MAVAIAWMFFLILSLLTSGGICRTSFSKQHKSITIKAGNGQMYECVNFYKQPAFLNLSLKLDVIQNMAKLQGQKVNNSVLKGIGCPNETVPVLISGDVYDHSRVQMPAPVWPMLSPIEHCVAVVRTKVNPTSNFFGASAWIDIYKPQVQNSQWSSARIKLANGGNSIEAGWMYAGKSDVFKDNEAHLYAKFTAGGKECINLNCPGFVQVSTEIPLGVIPQAYSTTEKQYYWVISIDKHQDDGNWWLSIDHEKYMIGYWPKSIFTTLTDVANQVEWGGEIINPGPIYPLPEMGNARKAKYNTQKSSCFSEVTYVDGSFVNVNPQDTQKVWDCENQYTVLDGGDQGKDLGRLIFYGGPNDPASH